MSEKLKIKAIIPDTLISILKDLGLNGDIESMILADIESGFELNEDDTIDIVKYLAWLTIKTGKVKHE